MAFILKFIFCACMFTIQLFFCKATVLDLKSEEVDGFIKTLDIRVIYFEKKAYQLVFPTFLDEYIDAAKILHSYGVKLAKVNCTTEKHAHCYEADEPSLFIFKDSKLLKTIPLNRVKTEPHIVANILHRFVLKHELGIVQDQDEFKEILDKSKGKNNLILAHVQSVGMKDYRNFLEVAFGLGDSFKFYMTTELPVNLFGGNSKIKVFLCKDQDCKVRHYAEDNFKIISLATFLQSVTLPGAILLEDDEKIPYNKDPLPINIVYVFERNKEDIASSLEKLEGVAKSSSAAIGIVLVQVEKHLSFIKKFGLADDSGFPAIGFIPSYKVEGDDMDHVDVFTSHDKAWQQKDIGDFIQNLVKNPTAVYGASVNTRSLAVTRPVEYATIVEDNTMEYLFVGFCMNEVEECSSFNYDFQRLSRTFDRHFKRGSSGRKNVKFSIILCDKDMDDKFKIQSYPAMRLHKKDEAVREFTPFTGLMIYEELLEFVKQSTGETYVLPLPWSGLDLIMLDSLLDPHEGSETASASGEEIMEETSEDWDDSELTPEETEDDEVAAAGYEIYFTKALGADHVQKLNDTSFNITLAMYDFAVVFFFLTWDARCQAFTPSYGAAAKSLEKPDGSDTKIGVLQVDCFDWEDVCRKENVYSYPTIRVYRKMKPHLDYHGVLDEPSLVRTIKLLLAPLPVKLTSDGEAVGFEVGKFPMPSIMFTDISVMGLFALESSVQVPVFQSAAQMMEGQHLFGYATQKVATDASSRLGVPVPSIVLVKRNDPLQNMVDFQGDYTVDSILDFVKHSSLPLYGELSPVNFPDYYSRNQPFLVVFKEKSDNDVDSVIADVVKSGEIEQVSFCWVDISLKMNRDILEAYTEKQKEGGRLHYPTVVLVNHNEGKTYTYQGELRKDLLVSWIRRCLDQSQDFTGELSKSEWKPRLEGYDFLAKMREESGEEDGKKDIWSSTSGHDDENYEEDDDKEHDDVAQPADHHHQRFHAAFQAKKQSRIDQHSHTTQHTHTEL